MLLPSTREQETGLEAECLALELALRSTLDLRFLIKTALLDCQEGMSLRKRIDFSMVKLSLRNLDA